jgi:hypothetical protein
MDSRFNTGGILWLRELTEKHPAEITADFRSRYNLSIENAGVEYSYREATYLTFMLLKDTSSWLSAAYNKWDYPASKEYLMQLTTFDLLHTVNSKKKPKPLNRPYKTEEETKKGYLNGKVGNTKNIDQNKVRTFLQKLGHKPQGE